MPGGPGFDAYMGATSGGTNSSVSSGYTGSGSQSGNNNNNNNNNNQSSPGHPSGGYEPNKDIPVDPRSYTASGQAQNDYEDSLPAQPEPTGLEALILNKDKLQNIPAGNGLNQYQVEMEKFKNSPGGLALFKKRFPNPLVKIGQGIGSYFKKGGALGILFNALSGSKDAASKFTQNASTMAKDIGSLFGLDSLKTKLLGIAAGGDTADVSNFIQGEQAYDPSGLEGYKDAIFKDLYAQMPNIDVSMEDEYSNFQPEISSDTSADQQEEVARDDERLNNVLIDLGIVGDQPLSSVTENVSETIYDDKVNEDANMDAMPYAYPGLDLPRTGTYPDNPLAGMEGYPKVQTGVEYDAPLGQGGEFNFNEYAPSTFNNPNYDYGNIFSENVVGQTPVLPNTFPGLEPDLSGFGQANGGYMSSFPNQNLNTESLSASDNIDDRIMKNLQFEKMSPGMMGYNQGGRVMSTYDKLKAIADNNYG